MPRGQSSTIARKAAAIWKLEAGSRPSVVAVAIKKRLQSAAQFGWKVLFPDGVEERDSRLIGLELGDAARTLREVALQLRMHCGGQVMLDEIRQQSHEVGAAAFV
jgi:hypothetical protein